MVLTSALRFSILAGAFCLARSQTAVNPPAFDAASIHAHREAAWGGRSRPPGGAMAFMPGGVTSGPFGVSARRISQKAYQLTDYQLSGGPRWLDSPICSI
jgi:hypothetical protein